MMYYDRIDVSEGVHVNKTINTCHYWYFLNKGFIFQPNVCNRYNNLLMMSLNISDIVVSNIKGAVYCCIISGISKG